ncbi:phage tail sheath family protein [Roseomonas populi]|uniref:Phage tail sheath subtilisin-like domain-containing protein n=1 Tax=Roseomonas populi TaxID=3121582 RepID=A0ABT1X3Q9_9PROT|nr:phage tail sheath C-terminal domain-containing protein [Roseomonas pecuniae]MCR0982747.1 phage tail sheath subtilisin-like domain-containing protein [Roseomonas pecuniae]
MPDALTYPGVYVQELPSGVRTIIGVGTSSTAFVDSFSRGPLDTAVQVTSWAAFERVFGGLRADSEGSYAVQQFFLNGGSTAWIVRVAGVPEPPDAATPPAAPAALSMEPAGKSLMVKAVDPGKWGNRLRVVATAVAGSPKLFNLMVQEVVSTAGNLSVLESETFLNLSMVPGEAGFAPDVVNTGSRLVRLEVQPPGQLPTLAPVDARGGVADAAWKPLAGGTEGALPDAKALTGSPDAGTGLYALERISPAIFNLLCLPRASALDSTGFGAVISKAQAFCRTHRAFLLVDPPAKGAEDEAKMAAWVESANIRDANAAVYFPRLSIPDPLNGFRLRTVGPSGTVAGIYARTDAARGVWKAPAGVDATLAGATPVLRLTDPENGNLNPRGVNALRTFPIYGPVVWGARTLVGADQMASQWKYVPVRRTALFIEETLFQGLRWAVFEPNDEPLWTQIRMSVDDFMHGLFRQGAFQGATPREAYLVQCDATTTTQGDIDRGIVNLIVGFAPLKPAEFVVLKLQQIAGQTS